MVDKEINDLGYKIRGCLFEVYNNLGPGLLESIYEQALIIELGKMGLKAACQVPISVIYEGHDLGTAMRLDIVVEDKVIIELKSVEKLLPVHHKQLLTYMKLANKHLGYLVNFNSDNFTDNIKRKVL